MRSQLLHDLLRQVCQSPILPGGFQTLQMFAQFPSRSHTQVFVDACFKVALLNILWVNGGRSEDNKDITIPYHGVVLSWCGRTRTVLNGRLSDDAGRRDSPARGVNAMALPMGIYGQISENDELAANECRARWLIPIKFS